MMLNDRVAIVTGGGRGIGAGIVEKLAAEGATVVVADVEGENARAVADGIVNNGGDAFGVGIDVTDPPQVQDMVRRWQAKWSKESLVRSSTSLRSLDNERAQTGQHTAPPKGRSFN